MSDFLILNEEEKKKNLNKLKIKEDLFDKEKTTKNLMESLNDFLYSFQSIKTKQKLIFYRLISTMVNSGMSILNSVSTVKKQEKDPLFRKILSSFEDNLRQGKNLSECMEIYPSSFGESEISIVKSGEKTGQLNVVLLNLSDQIEKVENISGKIKSAMVYPAFVILVVIAVIFVMMIKVVPKLLEIFEGDFQSLPISTKILISISDFFTNAWIFLILIFVILFFVIGIWKKTYDGKYIYDNFKLKIPIFGEIIRKTVLSKFSRVFASLISSGVSIVESLNITSKAVGNEVYKQRIILLSKDVGSGIRVWESLDGDKLFPDMMVQMIQVGEQTAKLNKTITKVADFYDEQIDNQISVLNKLLEPFIIIVLAVVVGFIAIAIIQPIMNLSDVISET